MIVILVGPDGSGKTTLYHNLQKQLPYAIFEKGTYPGPDPEIREERKNKFKTYKRLKETVIFDRNSLIDDFVYEPLFSGNDSVLAENIPEVQELLKDTKIIYLDCSTAILKKRIKSRGDEFIGVEQLERIKLNYIRSFVKLDIYPYYIDTGIHDEKHVLNTVLEVIKNG